MNFHCQGNKPNLRSATWRNIGCRDSSDQNSETIALKMFCCHFRMGEGGISFRFVFTLFHDNIKGGNEAGLKMFVELMDASSRSREKIED